MESTLTINWDIRSIIQQQHSNTHYGYMDTELQAVNTKSNVFYLKDSALCGHLVFHPHRHANYSSVYLILHSKSNDHRKVEASFECGSHSSFRIGSVQTFRQNECEPSLFALQYLQKTPVITCCITIYQDTMQSIANPSHNEPMDQDHIIDHVIPRQIALIITNKARNDMDSYDLYVPPTKKRKRNAFRAQCHPKTFRCVRYVNTAIFTAHSTLQIQGNEIEIEADKVKDVDDIIHFMGNKTLTRDCDVFAVIYLAEKYGFDAVKTACIDRLIANVSIDTFYRTINVFHQLDMARGYNELIVFGRRHYERLRRMTNYEQLSYYLKCELRG